MLTILGLIAIPVGALLLNSCGPENMTEQELALDETTNNWGYPLEYGHCTDTLDNNGDGLLDSYDPECHLNPGPLNDLSLVTFPWGHNFFPDITMMLPIGPGWLGEFREAQLVSGWLKFLTEPDGNTASAGLLIPGMDPEVVPLPAITGPDELPLGTWHQGNNGNLSLRALHVFDLFHPPPPPPVVEAVIEGAAAAGAEAGAAAASAEQAPQSGEAASTVAKATVAKAATAAAGATATGQAATPSIGDRYKPVFYPEARGPRGGHPGVFYEPASQVGQLEGADKKPQTRRGTTN